MGWASRYIARLALGEVVSFRPQGQSMAGRVESGSLCTVEPIDVSRLVVGDVVLCTVRGRQFLHLVKAIRDGRFQIGNNHGHVNGWVTGDGIHGRLVSTE